MRRDLVDALVMATNAPGTGLAQAALVIAQIEYPRLDAEHYLRTLDAMGHAANRVIEQETAESGDSSTLARIKAFNAYLFEDLQFIGNRERYEDPRNSCLNEVIDRRTGIPITLSLVYMEVGRRAGLHIDGVNFPGHFLVRCPEVGGKGGSGLIVDPFHGGALLSEPDCRVLLQKHVGSEVAFSKSLLAPATRQQIVVRMLLNLKRLYVHMRSFPQARLVTELLLSMTPSALSELRDRGLLAYHLNDVTGALRDLQTYLRLSSMSEMDKEARDEHEQISIRARAVRRLRRTRSSCPRVTVVDLRAPKSPGAPAPRRGSRASASPSRPAAAATASRVRVRAAARRRAR
jgi:regulator of sirC expression with transglutaminase-like and TPR domain